MTMACQKSLLMTNITKKKKHVEARGQPKGGAVGGGEMLERR